MPAIHSPCFHDHSGAWVPSGAHTPLEKQRKPVQWFSCGYHGQQYYSWGYTHDDDYAGAGVVQDGGHTPANRLRYNTGLYHTVPHGGHAIHFLLQEKWKIITQLIKIIVQ